MKKINYDLIYLSSFILLALSMPLSRAVISAFSIFIPLVWLIQGDIKNKITQITNNKVLVTLILLVFFVYLSLLWSDDVGIKIISSIDYKYLLLIPIFYTSMKKEWTNKIITAFLLGMFISEILSYGIYFELWSINERTPENPSPFMHHIEYSIFLSFSAILLLSRIISKNYTIKEKFFMLPFFLTVVGNLFFTIGRTGQITFVLAILTMFILHYRVSLKSIAYSIITISLIYISAYNISDNFEKRVNKLYSEAKFISNNDFTSSIGIRMSYYILASDMVQNNPINILFGTGYNDHIKYINTLLDEKSNYKDYKLDEKWLRNTFSVHNQYLQIFFQVGLVGLLLLFTMIYFLINSKFDNKELKDISILFIVIFSFACLSDIMLELQFTRTFFILFISLFLINIKEVTKNLTSN